MDMRLTPCRSPTWCGSQDPLSLENTLWANTVLASGMACGVVVHTGSETRSAMNSSSTPPSKMPTLDLQVNGLAKLLFLLVNISALSMVVVPFVQTASLWADRWEVRPPGPNARRWPMRADEHR